MNAEHLPIVLLFLFKIACLVVGGMLCYWGYKMFMQGVRNANVLSGEGKSESYSIKVQKIAPGALFGLLGAAIISFTVFKGFSFTITSPALDPDAMMEGADKQTGKGINGSGGTGSSSSGGSEIIGSGN